MSEQPELSPEPDDYAEPHEVTGVDAYADREADPLADTETAVLDADVPVADAQEQRTEVADPQNDEYR